MVKQNLPEIIPRKFSTIYNPSARLSLIVPLQKLHLE